MSFVSGAGKTNVDLIFSGLSRLPREGEEMFSRGFDLQMGGGIPATLINLGGLGVPARIQTSYGEDMISRFIREQFEKHHVQPLNLYRGEKTPFNITAAMLTAGERTFVSYTDPFVWTPEIDEKIYSQSTGSKFTQMGLGSLDVYRRLKAEGTRLLFDTSLRDDLTMETYEQHLKLIDYYTPNQQEAMKLTGADTPEKAARVLSEFFDRVIVKLDRDGCLLLENGVQKIIPSLPCFEHLDATGAGDAFMAGLLYGLYHGYSFEECVLFGNITGGKCVASIGCLSATCDEDELLTLFRQYKDEFLS